MRKDYEIYCESKSNPNIYEVRRKNYPVGVIYANNGRVFVHPIDYGQIDLNVCLFREAYGTAVDSFIPASRKPAYFELAIDVISKYRKELFGASDSPVYE